MSLNREPSQVGTEVVDRPPTRSAALDFMRFAAAGLIVLYHYQDEGPWPLHRVSPVFERGYLATDFFLVLSGYVLGRAYGWKIAAGAVSDEQFLLRRVLRVWPAHLVMLAAFAAVIGLAELAGLSPSHPAQFQWQELPAQLALVHAWGLGRGAGWNLPTWSLSALIICYAAFPTLWRRLAGARAGASLFAGGLAVVWAADLVSRGLYAHALYDLPFNLGVLRALPLFVFGVCIARAGERAWPPQAWAGGLAVGAGTGVVLLQVCGRFDLLSVALLGLLIGASGEVRLRRGAALAAKAAQVSFALYVTHIFVSLIWFNAARALIERTHPPIWAQWGLWALSLPAALTAAVLFERLVDQPLQRAVAALLRWRRGRYPAPAQSG